MVSSKEEILKSLNHFNHKHILTIGDINISDKLFVSDPSYKLDTWCSGTIDNMLPGKYNCNILISKKIKGYDILALSIVHETITVYNMNNIIPKLNANIAVDSGLCGFFDYNSFKQLAVKEINNIKVSYDFDCKYKLFDNSVITEAHVESIYGGVYNCFINTNSDGLVDTVELYYVY